MVVAGKKKQRACSGAKGGAATWRCTLHALPHYPESTRNTQGKYLRFRFEAWPASYRQITEAQLSLAACIIDTSGALDLCALIDVFPADSLSCHTSPGVKKASQQPAANLAEASCLSNKASSQWRAQRRSQASLLFSQQTRTEPRLPHQQKTKSRRLRWGIRRRAVCAGQQPCMAARGVGDLVASSTRV